MYKYIPKKIYIYGISCCSPELNNIFTPVYDIERLGFYLISCPEKADIIIISGKLTVEDTKYLKNLLAKKTKIKLIAIGNCHLENFKFDMACLGCPPRPESIIDTLLEL